tara:strand:- start:184 stop:312 length:129 start_codon:yes stop_codon:yes gene_type:complete
MIRRTLIRLLCWLAPYRPRETGWLVVEHQINVATDSAGRRGE